jgi:DNA mismatch repair protein MutS
MSKLTPLLQQYHRIKKEHQGAILFFRIGDFYETFYEDAKICSSVLGITLTSRSHGKGNRIPLAGVPHHAAEGYVTKLLRSGYKVAVCDQVEDPKIAKGLVKREVREVITPGTVMSTSLLEEGKNNFLAGIAREGDRVGIAHTDLSTGEFFVAEVEKDDLMEELIRISPSEILISKSEDPGNSKNPSLSNDLLSITSNITFREDHYFTYPLAYEKLKSHFQVTSLAGFGCNGMEAGISAAGAIISYVEETQKSRINQIQKLTPYSPSDFLILDDMTRRNLELVLKSGMEGKSEQEGTLLHILDDTKTPMGKRLLRQWVLSPLMDLSAIQDRQDVVEELHRSTFQREDLRRTLNQLSDLERTLGRIASGKGNGRDVISLKNSLKLLPQLKEIGEPKTNLLRILLNKIENFQELVNYIEERIEEEPPMALTEGGLIRKGFNKQLDDLREIAYTGKGWISRLQLSERKRTGISSLKVGFNNVFGYYIEVTKPNLKRVPEEYIRKQTLVNSERFVTQDLQDYEAKILGAEERIKALEYEIFIETRDHVAGDTPKIQETTRAVSELDVLTSLAEVALRRGYVRPQVGEGDEIQIEEGRHPVVESMSLPEGFVPNDAILSNTDDQILLITGPNMSGKSTYLRQVGLIVIMAQMGSFVPAKKVKTGLVDRIFTRVGASDDLSKGISTFLAEMIETANILHNATSKSLVLLDEIGRGTATFDGLSIAWSVVEYLHANPRVSAKTLFATHYHELTALESLLPRVKNYYVAVKEWKEEILFLRKVLPGGANRSYGIEVGRLAGLPKEVVVRAKEILKNLESDPLTPRIARGEHHPKSSTYDQLTLFVPVEHPILKTLKELDINSLTPLEAINTLNEMKKSVNRES